MLPCLSAYLASLSYCNQANSVEVYDHEGFHRHFKDTSVQDQKFPQFKEADAATPSKCEILWKNLCFVFFFDFFY